MARAEYTEPKTIASLEELMKSLDGETVTVDYTEDAWSYGAPPPGGKVYSLKLFLDKDGIKEFLEDSKNPKSVFYQLNLIAKINEGDFEGVPVYTKVNSRIYRGKAISTMAGLLAKITPDPSKIPNPITHKVLAGLLLKVLTKEPIVKGELDWRGAYAYKDKDGKEQWENVYKHYTDFPIDLEDKNNRLHVAEVANKYSPGTKAEVRAQAFIARFFGKNETPPEPKVHAVNGVAAIPQLALEETPTIVPATSAALVQGVLAGGVPTASDVDMLLDLST